jgi:hypothetical protein
MYSFYGTTIYKLCKLCYNSEGESMNILNGGAEMASQCKFQQEMPEAYAYVVIELGEGRGKKGEKVCDRCSYSGKCSQQTKIICGENVGVVIEPHGIFAR